MVSCIMAALWKRGNFPGVHVMESRTVHFHKAAKVLLDVLLLK
jgi:hypothetical protein